MGSPINDPHPNDAALEESEQVQDPEDFFANGDGEDEGEEQLLQPREPGDDSPIEAGELPEGAPAQLVEPVAAEDLAGAGPEDIAEPEDGDEAEDGEVEEDDDEPTVEAEPEPDPEASAEVAEDDDETGNKRLYVVLQEVKLDQDVLNELLKAVKNGVQPLTALIEVHRTTVTNPKSALNGAWRRHKEEWVEPPRLAVVTASKIRTRTAKPRVREVIGFDFE